MLLSILTTQSVVPGPGALVLHGNLLETYNLGLKPIETEPTF